MTQVVYALAFLLFDREAGRVRPSVLAGLAAVVLAVASHLWLSGPWLEQAGLSAAIHPSTSAASPPAPPAVCSDGASRR